MANKKSSIRRGNNEGTIYQRPDGRWAAQVTTGYNESGRIQRKTIYGVSRTDVAMKLNDMVSEVYKYGYTNNSAETLETLMRHWVMIYKKSEVASRTFEKCMTHCNLYIFPEIGRLKPNEINPDIIQTLFVNLLEKKKLCVDTVKKCKYLLSQFFEYAIDKKYMTYNPTQKTKIKSREKDKSKEDEYKAIRKEDREVFLQAVSKSPFWKALCYCAMFCGLRIGEILALKWRNIDFEDESISIENAITQVIDFDEKGEPIKHKTIIGDTKTVASARENPMPNILIKALDEYKKRRTLEEALLDKITLTNPDDLVFSTETGNLRSYWGTCALFRKFLEKHDLQNKNIHFHALRHTFSNMLFEANENPKVIQALMGHKDVKTTMIYNSIDKRQVSQTKSVLDKISSDFEM